MIFFYFEKYLYLASKWFLTYSFLHIPAFILINLLIIRKIVANCIFPGSSYVIQKIITYRIGSLTAEDFSKQVSRFKQSINFIKINIHSINLNDANVLFRSTKSFKDSIISYTRNSKLISSKFTISKYQKKLCCYFEDIIDTLDESDIINLLENFVISKSQMMMDMSESQKQIIKIISIIDQIENFVDSYLMKKSLLSKISHFLFNDSFASYHRFRIEITNRYNYEEFTVNTIDNHNLDLMLLKPKIKNTLNDNYKPMNLIIMCGPNGTPYEYFNYSWLDFYVENGIYLLLWNYRGYGDSSGTASYQNIREDAETVHKFISKLHKWDNIGVHGISLGGIAACHLAGKNLVSTCFADRTFSSIDDIIKEYPIGNLLILFYKILFFNSSYNVDNFIQSKASKMISCDPGDTIIKDSASLKTGISNYIIMKKFNHDNKISNTKFDLFSMSINKQELDDYVSNISSLMKEIYDSTVIKKSRVEVQISLKKDNLIYNKLNEESPDEYKILNKLRKLLEEFDSVGENLLSLDKVNKFKQKSFLMNFFSNLLVWGSYKSTLRVKKRETANILASKKLTNFIKKIKKMVNNQSKYRLNEIQIKQLSKLMEFLTKIEGTFNKIIFQNETESELYSRKSLDTTSDLNCINESETEDLSNFLKNLTIGNILPLKCGHNGMLSREELDSYRTFLINCKFII